MAFGQGRAERRNGLGNAVLRQGDDIHVALGHEDALFVMRCAPRLGEAVKCAALVEERRVGGIEVFRLAVAHGAAAERDDTAARIGDREQDTVAEKIIGRAAVIGGADQAALGKQGFGHRIRHDRGLDGIARRREAEPEAADGLVAQPAPLKISERGFAHRRAQRLFVIRAGRFHHLQQPGAALLLRPLLGR